jgi:hypothetical protein
MDQHDNEAEEETAADRTNTSRRRQKPTCPHYQQLSTMRTARRTQSRFVVNTPKARCCSSGSNGGGGGGCGGGEQTKLGVHDIEDLLTFGKNPHREASIALYREEVNGNTGSSFGITFIERRKRGGGFEVDSLNENGIAAKDGRLKRGDWIVAVNGRKSKRWTVDQGLDQIRAMTKDPLVLDILRKEETQDEEEEDKYSEHAVCPYYLSRAIMPHANLVFAPYNYVLDPNIRKTLGIDLAGSVVVLDEAHNVEDTLCESGSGAFGELDLCQLVAVLAHYSNQKQANATENDKRTMELLGSREERQVSEVAHELLLFVEKLVGHMRSLREGFERSPGLEKVKQEHAKFRLADDHPVEVTYHGPTGHGFKGKAIGCAPMLEELGITPEICARLSDFAQSMESHLFGSDSEDEDRAGQAVLNDLLNVVSRFELASKNPE